MSLTSSSFSSHDTVESAPPCSLYLAPSSVPEAGLGVYTGVNLEQGEDIELLQEVSIIPIHDLCKTLPCRGEKRFQSWMSYVWPSHTDALFPSYEDEVMPPLSDVFYHTPQGLNGVDPEQSFSFTDADNERISAIVPGVLSLTNSHAEWQNIQQQQPTTMKLPDNDNSFAATATSSSLQTTRELVAGSELLVWYGQEYDDRMALRKKYEHPSPQYETLDFWKAKLHKWAQERKNLPREKDKRFARSKMKQQLDKSKLRKIEKRRRAQVAGYLANRRRRRQEAPQVKKSLQTNSMDETPKGLVEESSRMAGPTKDLTWLDTNGVCLDALRLAPSPQHKLVDQVGAIANRSFTTGSIVLTSPLLVIRRKDLITYESNTSLETHKFVKNPEQALGFEILLNYCYGHSDSDVLFAPLAPHMHQIRPATDNISPNVQLEWPSKETVRKLMGEDAPGPEKWFEFHPLDLLEESGQVLVNLVATQDIGPGDELFLDFGHDWEQAYKAYQKGSDDRPFRHEIGVPDDFFSPKWTNAPAQYELTPIPTGTLAPGEIRPITWKHNSQPVANATFVMGLPENFAQSVIDFADHRGILALYRDLLLWRPEEEEAQPVAETDVRRDPLQTNILQSNQWYVFDADQHLDDQENQDDFEKWFVHRFRSTLWDFNMHYVSAWNERARVAMWEALQEAGLNEILLESMGTYFELEQLTCFHHSFMGISYAAKSRMHSDLFATGNKAFTIIFPLILAESNDDPELLIQSDNADLVMPIKYEFDRAIVMGDWGYHSTAPVDYRTEDGAEEDEDIRVVFQMYCAEINDDNLDIIRHHYNEEDPAPFMSQFYKLKDLEVHWTCRKEEEDTQAVSREAEAAKRNLATPKGRLIKPLSTRGTKPFGFQQV